MLQLFDQVILMSSHHVVYQGPTNRVIPYLDSLCAPSSPLLSSLRVLPTQLDLYKNGRISISTLLLEVLRSEKVDFLVQGFENSDEKKELLEFVKQKMNQRPELKSIADAKTRESTNPFPPVYRTPFSHTFSYLAVLCTIQNIAFIIRDRSFIVRNIQCLIIGLVLGSLFWNLPIDDFVSRYGLIFYQLMFLAVGPYTHVPLNILSRTVFYKQHRSGFYSTISYVLGRFISQLPGCMLEAALSSSVIYPMVAFDHSASRFWIFVGICALMSLTFGSVVRVGCCIFREQRSAMAFASLFVLACSLFSG
jgi:hypothetical protein